MAVPHKVDEYSLTAVIAALENPSPERNTFAGRLGDIYGRQYDEAGWPDFPSWDRSKTIPLATRWMARSMGAGDASQAGDLIVDQVQAVAEAARPSLVLDRVGCQRLELVQPSGDVSLPSWDAENTSGSWIGERGTGTEIALTTRTVTASPKSALSYIKFSRRIEKQTANLEPALLAEMNRSVAGVIETGFLNGPGTEHAPMGLVKVAKSLGYSDTWAASSPSYTEVVAQAEAYLEAHGSWANAAWICSADLAIKLVTTEKASATAQFLLDMGGGQGPTLLGRPVAISDYLPAGHLLLINAPTIVQVYWGAPYSLLDRYSDGMDIKGEAMLLVDNLCDVVSLQPAQVCLGVAA